MSDGKLERRKKLMAITLEKIGKIVEVLPVFFHTKETINVIGEPGMGKTEILSGEMENLITLEVERVWGGEAEMKKKGFDVKNHYSFIDGSGMPTEAIVIPYINNEAVDHLQRDLIPELKKARRFLADKKNDGLTYVIFIDEFTSFNQSDQRTLMNLIQSGLLPDGTRIDKKRIWFILAGNPAPSIPGFEDSDSPTHEMELAVITRGATFFVAPDVDSFLLWGATASKQWTGEKLVGRSNIHPYLLSALTKNKELYNKKDITDVRVLNSRTAKKLSNYLYGVEDLKAQKKETTVGNPLLLKPTLVLTLGSHWLPPSNIWTHWFLQLNYLVMERLIKFQKLTPSLRSSKRWMDLRSIICFSRQPKTVQV